MASPVKRIKSRLSRVDMNSWHYKVFAEVWEKKARKSVHKKACTYYWFYLPLSLLALGFLAIAAVIISILGLFFGFIPRIGDEDPVCSDDFFYPYKRTGSGKKLPVAPWEIAFVIGAVFGGYYLVSYLMDHKGVLMAAGGIGAAAILIGLFVFLFSKGWNNPFIREARTVAYRSLSSWWDNVCPTLEVVEKSDIAKQQTEP